MITVPAYFNNKQKKATRKAGKIAGLNVLRLITEPAAAAVAYGLDDPDRQVNVFVFDLGGGTFDISILKVKDQKYKVIATNGDTELGGIDFDDKLLEYCMGDFKKKHGKDMSEDLTAVLRLREACELAKKELSSLYEVLLFTMELLFNDI